MSAPFVVGDRVLHKQDEVEGEIIEIDDLEGELQYTIKWDDTEDHDYCWADDLEVI